MRQKLNELIGRQDLIYDIESVGEQSPTYRIIFNKHYSGVVLECMKKLSTLGISAQIQTFEKGYLSSFYNNIYLVIDGPLKINLEKFRVC